MTETDTSAPVTTGRSFHPKLRMPLHASTGTSIDAADAAAPRFVLCHVRSGHAVFALEGRRFPVSAPAVILLDERLRPVISNAQALQLANLYFQPVLINNVFTLETLHTTELRQQFSGSVKQDLFLLHRFLAQDHAERIHHLAPHVHERLSQLFQLTVEQARQQPDAYWPCRTRSYLIELLFQLRMLEPAETIHPGAQAGSRTERALLYLNEHYHQDFTLGDLARACHTNRTTLNTEFRASTGMSVRAYVITQRMKVAAAMLRDTQVPVAEIMQRVGYANPSHFTRAFRQTLGSSPSDYRQANSWMLRKA